MFCGTMILCTYSLMFKGKDFFLVRDSDLLVLIASSKEVAIIVNSDLVFHCLKKHLNFIVLVVAL